MREQPGAPELLEGVAAFLRAEIMPAVSDRLAFHARVAANVLDIVRRELVVGPQAERSEVARLAGLLGMSGEAETLSARLADAIAEGAVAPDDPALVDHLWATTLATVAIDQPTYATYRRAVESGSTATHS